MEIIGNENRGVLDKLAANPETIGSANCLNCDANPFTHEVKSIAMQSLHLFASKFFRSSGSEKVEQD